MKIVTTNNQLADHLHSTRSHCADVYQLINIVVSELMDRANSHDMSKLEEPELSIFSEYGPKLKSTTYGSSEYKSYLKEMDKALQHHYTVNRHHPEHFKDGIQGMNLIDVVEMLCDWIAAASRHDDGDILKSISVSQERFKFSDELKSILINTVEFLSD